MSQLWEVLVRHFPEFRSGFLVTVQLVAVSFGDLLGRGAVRRALRLAPMRWVRWVGGLYVEFFRNTPLLVLLTIAYLGLRRAGSDRAVGGRDGEPRPLHGRLRCRDESLGRLRRREGANRRRPRARVHLSAGAVPDRIPQAVRR